MRVNNTSNGAAAPASLQEFNQTVAGNRPIYKFSWGMNKYYLRQMLAVAQTHDADGIISPVFDLPPTDAYIGALYGVNPHNPLLGISSDYVISLECKSSQEAVAIGIEKLLTGEYPGGVHFDKEIRRIKTSKLTELGVPTVEQLKVAGLNSILDDLRREYASADETIKASVKEKVRNIFIAYLEAVTPMQDPLLYVGKSVQWYTDDEDGKRNLRGFIPAGAAGQEAFEKAKVLYEITHSVIKKTFGLSKVGAPFYGSTDPEMVKQFNKSLKEATNAPNSKYKTPMSRPADTAVCPGKQLEVSQTGVPIADEKGYFARSGYVSAKSQDQLIAYKASTNATAYDGVDYITYRVFYPVKDNKGQSSIGAQYGNFEAALEGADKIPTWSEVRNMYIELLVAGPSKLQDTIPVNIAELEEIALEYITKNFDMVEDEIKAKHSALFIEWGLMSPSAGTDAPVGREAVLGGAVQQQAPAQTQAPTQAPIPGGTVQTAQVAPTAPPQPAGLPGQAGTPVAPPVPPAQ